MARAISLGNYLSVASALVTSAPLTLACWFNVTNFTFDKTLVSIEDGASSNRFGLVLAGSNTARRPARAVVENGGTVTYAESVSDYLANTWHFAAAVFVSDTERHAYLGHGGSKGSDSTNLSLPGSLDRTNLGARLNGTTAEDLQNGAQAEVAIWDAALSDDEITSLSQRAQPLTVRPQDLLHYWPLLGRSDPEMDLVGDVDMDLSGTPSQAAHAPIIFPRPPQMQYGTHVTVTTPVRVSRYLEVHAGRVQQADHRYLALVDGVPEPEAVSDYALVYVDETSGELTVKDTAGTVTSLESGGGGGAAYAETIGDGSTTAFAVAHNLGTSDVMVQVWDVSGAEPVLATDDAASIEVDDSNTVTVTFAVAPAADSYRVVVLASGGAAGGGAEALGDLSDVNAPSPSDGDVLTYDAGSGVWQPAALSGGDSTPYISDWSYRSGTFSTSAYAWKGNEFTPDRDVELLAIGYYGGVVAGATYQAAVATMDGSNQIDAITKSVAVTLPGTLQSTDGGWVWLYFSSAQTLSAGTTYGLLVGRTDGSDTYALPLPFNGGTGAENAVPMTGLSHGLAWRIAQASPAVGDAVDRQTTQSVAAGYLFRYV